MEEKITNLKVHMAALTERVNQGFLHVNSQLTDIKENHLKHLQKDYYTLTKDYSDLKSTVDKMGVRISFIVAGITIIIQIAFQIFFK